MTKLTIIQLTTPDYRKPLFDLLYEVLGKRFELYRGACYFESSVVSDMSISARSIKNYFFLSRKVVFQTGVWHLLFKKDVIVMELQPRNITTWVFLCIRKPLGLKTVLWGHAWPRKGAQAKSDKIRHVMRLLATQIVVYTAQQAKMLKTLMPKKDIKYAANAVLSSKIMGAASQSNPKDLIYVGRLTKKKKPFFLVKAFRECLEFLPSDVMLHIVGDGPEYEKIDTFILQHKLENRIHLHGHINDIDILKALYAQSHFSVSPGYVGLSITQSLGFGVPMLVSRSENHSPEIEALQEGSTGVFYETDHLVSFRESLKLLYDNKQHWNLKRQELATFCKNNYSIEAMAAVFINLVAPYEA